MSTRRLGQQLSLLRELRVTAGSGSKEIRAVADWLREQRPATKSQHTLKEWRNFVRSSFGDPLTALDLSAKDEEIGRKLKKAIEAAVDAAPNTAPTRAAEFGAVAFFLFGGVP